MTKQQNEKTRAIPFVRRPGRYVGREWNLKPLNPSPGLRIVLVYPDVYEIGMSHYGLQVLYHQLNLLEDTAVERCFAPWPDMEDHLRKSGHPLTTLESRTPLSQADILMITLPHELCYTNVLNILDLAGLPLRASDRSSDHPLVIAGGICTLNPEPIAAFFDGIFVGDGEEAVREIAAAVRQAQNDPSPRETAVQRLAAVPGCYVPAVHDTGGRPPKTLIVQRRIFSGLQEAAVQAPPLVPHCKPVHERVVVEVARGCPRHCRFCQARQYYQPVRRREPDEIMSIIARNLVQTGYDEVSLLSLNVIDYPDIESLVESLMTVLTPRYVSLSLPSLRPEKLTPAIIEQIQRVRKSGFTLAPEAGTDILRSIIGKPFETRKLLRSVHGIFSAGWQVIKLYFMIGHPHETDDDIQGIIELVRQIIAIGRKCHGRKAEINVSASIFVPKPHTPFQYCGQADEQTVTHRIRILRNGLKIPGVKFSYHDPESSVLEAVFARGGRNLTDVLIRAFENGCRFDAWRDWFQPAHWQTAFRDHQLDPHALAETNYSLDDSLPWDYIDIGTPRESLKQSFNKSEQISSTRSPAEAPAANIPSDFPMPSRSGQQGQPPHRPSVKEPVTYLGLYSVLDEYRLFAHLELSAAILRAFRRAELPLVFTEGFNPRPRATFSQPAPLGFEQYYTPIAFRLSKGIPGEELIGLINRQLPSAMSFSAMVRLKVRESDVFKRFIAATYAFSLTGDALDRLQAWRSQVTIVERDAYMESVSPAVARLPRRYNVMMTIHHAGLKAVKLRDIISDIYGNDIFPYDRATAARIAWATDPAGRHPVISIDGTK